jgi:subtilisin
MTLALAVTALLVASGAGSKNGPHHPPRAKGGVVPGHYIVVLKATVRNPGRVAARQARAYGAQVTHVYGSALKGYAAKIPAGRVASLRKNSAVRFVTPDRKIGMAGQTVGTGVSRIHAVNKANKGTGVNVAVLDTGIDVNHPDLAANIVGGTNCSKGGGRNYDDVHGHGTHVAGIIAALDNEIGVVGVAPEAKLWAVRVLDRNGSGTWSNVICGVDFVDSKSPAKGGPITVANMSLGGGGSDDGNCGNTNGDALHKSICQAVADGVTFAVAAGNSSTDMSRFVPAAYDEVIAVSALADSDGQPCDLGAWPGWGADDDFATFSNYATSAADLSHLMAAPGVSIYSTWLGGGYKSLSGTSMASPHIAGAAALYVAAHQGASPTAVRDGLKALGEPVNTNFNGECPAATGKKNTQGRVSHTDSNLRHVELELRVDSL